MWLRREQSGHCNIVDFFTTILTLLFFEYSNGEKNLRFYKIRAEYVVFKNRYNFALVTKAFFVYCKVVKEKEYSSFLNR